MALELLSAPPAADRAAPALLRPRGAEGAPLQTLHRIADALGLPLMCVDSQTGEVMSQTDRAMLPWVPRELREKSRNYASRVQTHPSGLIHFEIVLPQDDLGKRPCVAVGYILAMQGLRPRELERAAAEAGWSKSQLDDWLLRIPCCQEDLLRRHLALAVQHSQQEANEQTALDEINQLVGQLNHSLEEINLLHTLTQNMQVSRAPEELVGLSLSQLHQVIRADGHAVWLCRNGRQPLFVYQGRLPLDQAGLSRLIERFEGADWSRPLVKNNIEGTLLGADFPGLRNFLIAPIGEGSGKIGWLFSCNLSREEEFHAVQVNLLKSVASILGTHGRNQELFRQHDEMLLGFVKSMVSSLDAKDPYTRGHSERVALAARSIGMQMGLPEEDLRDIYLSGLLHDIGKIGLDDQILRKSGTLTPAEFEQVKKHPVIGYNILAGLKNLQGVIPGVRNHHEAWAGNGYPDNLVGEEIPLMARIISVADAYDAMGSDRPYRKGLPVERVEEVLRKGSGQQWDPRIVEAFFQCNNEIYELCQRHQHANAGILNGSDEYLIPLASGRGAEDRVREALSVLAGLPVVAAKASAR